MRTRPNPTYAEKQRRSAFRLGYIRRYSRADGLVYCPGYGRPPHYVPASHIQADHIYPRSRGGESGLLRALCGQCNPRRGARAIEFENNY